MTLNSSGRMSLGTSNYSSTNANVELELGQSGTTQISMNDTAVRALAKVTGNNTQIKFSDLYGKIAGSYSYSVQSSSGTVLNSSHPVGYTSGGSATTDGTTFNGVVSVSGYGINKIIYVKYVGTASTSSYFPLNNGNANSTNYDFTIGGNNIPSTVTVTSINAYTASYDLTALSGGALSATINYTVNGNMPMAPFGNGSSSGISSYPYVQWNFYVDSGLTKLVAQSNQGTVQRKIVTFYATDTLGTQITSVRQNQTFTMVMRNGPPSGKFNVKLPNNQYMPSSTTGYSLDSSGNYSGNVSYQDAGNSTFTAYIYDSSLNNTGVYVDLTLNILPQVSVSVSPSSGYVGIPISWTVTNGPANGTYYVQDQYQVSSGPYSLNSSGGSTNSYTPVAAGTYTWTFYFSDNQTYTISNYSILPSTFVYPSSGTYTLTIPSGIGSVEVAVIGGSGGTGAYHDGGYGEHSKGGGLGGAVTGVTFTVTSGTVLTLTVGAAGQPGHYAGTNVWGYGANGTPSIVSKNGSAVVTANNGEQFPSKVMGSVVIASGVTSSGTILSNPTQSGSMDVSDSTPQRNGSFDHYSLYSSLANSLYNTTTRLYPPYTDAGWDKLGRYSQIIDSSLNTYIIKGTAEQSGFIRVIYKP